MRSDPGVSLLDLCREHQLTIVTAESCTAGLIAATLTDIPGSSDVVWGGFISYANDAKVRALGVSESLITEYGAVSCEVVEAMASGALQNSSADLSVAVSGIAGPGGGSPDKPVGTVWIAAALRDGKIYSRCFNFDGDRKNVRLETVRESFKICEKIILDESSLDSVQH